MAESDHHPASPPDVPEPHRLLGVLADAANLRAFAALVLGPPEGIAPADLPAASGLGPEQAARALARLSALGLALPGAAGYAASPAVLRESLGAQAKRLEEQAAKEFATDDPARLSVLLNSFSDGRLTHLPEKFEKRRIVLEEIAQRFEPGTRYAEAEVNLILNALHPDFAALRRYLVDAVLLSREEGYYWRSGGAVHV
jgi:hypothetical protein